LVDDLTSLESNAEDLRVRIDGMTIGDRPRRYTCPQLTEIAGGIKSELTSDDLNAKRGAVRGLVPRIVAKRTDDEIIGVMYVNQIFGNVPPRGNEVFRGKEVVPGRSIMV